MATETPKFLLDFIEGDERPTILTDIRVYLITKMARQRRAGRAGRGTTGRKPAGMSIKSALRRARYRQAKLAKEKAELKAAAGMDHEVGEFSL